MTLGCRGGGSQKRSDDDQACRKGTTDAPNLHKPFASPPRIAESVGLILPAGPVNRNPAERGRLASSLRRGRPHPWPSR